MSKKLVLTVSDDIYQHIKKQAKQIGIPYLEYVRYLLTKDKESKDNASTR
jgi:predicted DNA binding CopG/RHH family protein